MATTMRIPIALPARSNPGQDTDLSTRLQQITSQKGPFRHITEQSVSLDDGVDVVKEDVDEDDPEEDSPERRRDALWKGRQEMLALAQRTSNDILTALDFISLSLSKQSKLSLTTCSPGLKELVPMSSLDLRHVRIQPDAKDKSSKLNQASIVYRSGAFKNSFDQLMAASERLGRESTQESKFWADLANLRQLGWPLSRHPRAGKTIGVHYGLADSAPQFRNQGFAILRQDDAANIYIDKPAPLKHKKRLRMSVYRASQLTGTFSRDVYHQAAVHSAQDDLTEARSRLIDEELFYEMDREARLIANQGVLTRDRTIEVKVDEDLVVVVSHSDDQDDVMMSSGSDDNVARGICTFLQSLLLEAHRKSCNERSLRPPPVSLRPSPSREYAILRPLLAFLRHHRAVQRTRMFLSKSLQEPLQKSGLEFSFTVREGPEISEGSSLIITGPRTTYFEIMFPSGKQCILTVRTYIGAPEYGTVFEVSALQYDFARMAPSASRRTIKQIAVDLFQRCVLDLMQVFRQEFSSSSGVVLEIVHPYRGELRLTSALAKSAYTIVVSLEDGNALILRVTSTKISTGPTGSLAWIWTSDGLLTSGDAVKLGLEGKVTGQESFTDVAGSIQVL